MITTFTKTFTRTLKCLWVCMLLFAGTFQAWAQFSLPPVVAAFSPSSGPVGTLVTMNGSNLSNATAVNIGGKPAVVVSNNGSAIVAMVMPGAATGLVTVITAAGTGVSSGAFQVTATPYPSTQQGNKLVGTGYIGTNIQQGFSSAISANGNTAVFGGPFDNSSTGAIWVYTRNGTTWSQQGVKLTGAGETGAGELGFSVAISADGNTIIAGANSDNNRRGAAFIFTRNGTTWNQQTKLSESTISDFGGSVALSADGNTAIIGGYSNNGGIGAGWVYIRDAAGNWSQQSKLTAADNTGRANLGRAVAISADGNTVILGGSGDNDTIGAAWVFIRTGTTWMQQGSKLTANDAVGASDQGGAVAISADGNTAVVGGPFNDQGKGAGWVYIRTGSIWTQQSKLTNERASENGRSISVSADGNVIVLGSLDIAGNPVFVRNGIAWGQKALIANGESGFAGQSVALSADAQTVIIGENEDISSKIGNALIYIATPAPNTAAHDISFTNTTVNSTKISWTSGNGANRAVFMAAIATGGVTTQDGVAYTANASWGSGTQVGSTGWYCVYNGSDNSVNVNGLAANTTYRVMVVEYNGAGAAISYTNNGGIGNPANITTLKAAPTIQASGTYSDGIGTSTATTHWTNGNGSSRVVFFKKTDVGDPGSLIGNGSTYTANSAFGLGSQLASSGWYCVYNGTGNSVNITNLEAGALYLGVIYEYNGSGVTSKYLTTVSEDNLTGVLTISPAPATPTTSGVTTTAMTFNWPAVSGATGYTIYYSNNPDFTFDGVSDDFAESSPVSGTSFTLSGLSPSTTIYFKVAAANMNGQGDPSSVGAQSTNALPSITASDVTIPSSTVYGTASATGTFTLSANNLTGPVTITAPSGFELADTPSGPYNNVLTYSSGSTINANVLVRLSATAATGVYTGNISISTNGASASPTIQPATVNPAPLTITAKDVHKTYGEMLTDHANSTDYTATGLANGETIGGVNITYGAAATPTAAVNNYPGQVIASAATGGTFNPDNYHITYNTADITVAKADLTITANDVSKLVGATLTGGAGSTQFTATGLQNGETAGTVTIAYA